MPLRPLRPLALLFAALLAPLPVIAQSRSATPGAPATQSAAAAESEFLTRKAALKPDDFPARLELAHWARDHELFTQAAELAREVLDHDPDNRPAWSLLQQLDQSISLPAEPDVEEALKQEFNHRFHRGAPASAEKPATAPATTPSATGGPVFKTRNSRHFLICYDSTDAFAARQGSALEKAYDAFMFFFNMQKLHPAFLQKRLIVILFKNRDDYLAYAKSTEGADLFWAAGYYSQRTNRSAFYDDSSGPEAESVEKQVEKLRAMLKDLNAQISAANSKNPRAAAALVAERDHLGNILFQINTQVGNALGLMNSVKTVHEAAHQLAFNTGIQKRFVDYPLWFVEGLACSFEIEDRAGRRGPSIVNYGRVAVIKEAIRRDPRGGLIPLEQFISQPQPPLMDENTLNIFYAEGWALFHYLYKNNRAGMEKYLLAYQNLPEIQRIPPEKRLKLFTDAFGEDIPALQTKFTAYLNNLPNKAP